MIKKSGLDVNIENYILISKTGDCTTHLEYELKTGPQAKLHIENCSFYRPTRDYPIVAEITRIKPTFINRLKYVITGNRSYLGDVIIIDEIGDKHGDN